MHLIVKMYRPDRRKSAIGLRMELEDLPTRYREQAARQIKARQSRRRPAAQTPPARHEV